MASPVWIGEELDNFLGFTHYETMEKIITRLKISFYPIDTLWTLGAH